MCPLKSPPIKIFSSLGMALTTTSRQSQNSLFSWSPSPTCGAYVHTTVTTCSPNTNLNTIILSLCRITSITFLCNSIDTKNPTPFLDPSDPEYNNLYPLRSSALCPFHLVS
ncbi:hypothetical protein Hanom_Chr04g00367491 [Helianthus anomalus]